MTKENEAQTSQDEGEQVKPDIRREDGEKPQPLGGDLPNYLL